MWNTWWRIRCDRCIILGWLIIIALLLLDKIAASFHLHVGIVSNSPKATTNSLPNCYIIGERSIASIVLLLSLLMCLLHKTRRQLRRYLLLHLFLVIYKLTSGFSLISFHVHWSIVSWLLLVVITFCVISKYQLLRHYYSMFNYIINICVL